MPNVFGIADDILVIGYDKDGVDHQRGYGATMCYRWCQDVNLILNKDKYAISGVHQYPSLAEVSVKKKVSNQIHKRSEHSGTKMAGIKEQKRAASLLRH